MEAVEDVEPVEPVEDITSFASSVALDISDENSSLRDASNVREQELDLIMDTSGEETFQRTNFLSTITEESGVISGESRASLGEPSSVPIDKPDETSNLIGMNMIIKTRK